MDGGKPASVPVASSPLLRSASFWRPAPSRPGSSRSARCRSSRPGRSPPPSSTATASCCAPMRWPTAAGGCRSTPRTGVDPTYLKLLLAYEDRRFYSHDGVDPLALGRAALQLVTRGHIVSGGSTITMQLARLMEPRRERSVSRQAAPDGARDPDRAAAEQGPDSRSLSGAGAVRRQSRGHSRRLDRLFRQGAEAAVAGGSGAAGGVAAIAGNPPARSSSRGRRASRATACSIAWSRTAACRSKMRVQAKAVPVPRLRKPMPILAPHSADQALATREGCAGHRADAGFRSAEGAGSAGARPRRGAGTEYFRRHRRGRQ